jgi:hypothetical protein
MQTSQRSLAIPIPMNSPTKKTECVYNFFDPFKASPPNEFLRKLQVRIETLEPGFTKKSFKRNKE